MTLSKKSAIHSQVDSTSLRHATGTILKILFQDDFLYDQHSLKCIADTFDTTKDFWLATGCTHTQDGKTFYRPFKPTFHDNIHIGRNTLSSPSVISIKNGCGIFFDEQLLWYMDTDFYKQCALRYGLPKILTEICTVNRVGNHQISTTLADERLREKEFRYIVRKYAVKHAWYKIGAYRYKMYKRQLKAALKKYL
jgi:hypothetical protein